MSILIVAGIGAVALAFAYMMSNWINQQDGGTPKMVEIGGYIRDGAMAFLKSEYRVLSVFVLIVAVLLGWANFNSTDSDVMVALSFVMGALASGAAGFFGMRVATAANFRTASAARKSLVGALDVAFKGGAVMGMSVVGLAVIGLTVLWVLYVDVFGWQDGSGYTQALAVLSGFSLGASSIALFARVGGGIYTKAADVGADLVGKIEAGIPEDDPRNPATIADNVGDNVGDVAGMGADLFESYVGSIVGSMILGGALAFGASTAAPDIITADTKEAFRNLITLPLWLAGAGIVVSIIGTFLVRVKEGGNPHMALHKGTLGASALMLIAAWLIIGHFVPAGAVFVFDPANIDAYMQSAEPPQLEKGGHFFDAHLGIFLAIVVGLVAGTAIGFITEYYTSDHRAPVKGIAKQAETGAATVIIAGTAVGMRSTVWPALIIAFTIIAAFHVAGLYGIAMAALGMLSTTGIQLAVDAYGPIADNAGGIAEMSGLPAEVRERTDSLDAVGNTTAAIGKGFAIGSAALTALALFASFIKGAHLDKIDVLNTHVMAGLFIGGMLPFLFSAMAMDAVGRAAFAMIEEVRRQFREIPGLLEGKAVAEHAKCVAISTDSALREMILPGLIAVITPVAIGIWSLYALGGVLVGVTVCGVLLALYQSNAGGAWDNAKKYIEGGAHGGKGSDAHHAAVVGDTVGDPFKDTSGPSLNILIKLMSVVAVVIAPALHNFHHPTGDKKFAPEPAPKQEPVKTGAYYETDDLDLFPSKPAPETDAPAPAYEGVDTHTSQATPTVSQAQVQAQPIRLSAYDLLKTVDDPADLQ